MTRGPCTSSSRPAQLPFPSYLQAPKPKNSGFLRATLNTSRRHKGGKGRIVGQSSIETLLRRSAFHMPVASLRNGYARRDFHILLRAASITNLRSSGSRRTSICVWHSHHIARAESHVHERAAGSTTCTSFQNVSRGYKRRRRSAAMVSVSFTDNL